MTPSGDGLMLSSTFRSPDAEERSKFISRLLNGVGVTGSLAPAAKASEDLSFADIEKAVIDAIKTMILSNRRDIKASDIIAELKTVKTTTAEARRRVPRTQRES